MRVMEVVVERAVRVAVVVMGSLAMAVAAMAMAVRAWAVAVTEEEEVAVTVVAATAAALLVAAATARRMRLDAVSVKENNMREEEQHRPGESNSNDRTPALGRSRFAARWRLLLASRGRVGASTSAAGSASKEGALHMAIEVRARRVGRTSRRGEYRLKLLVGTYCRAKHNTFV